MTYPKILNKEQETRKSITRKRGLEHHCYANSFDPIHRWEDNIKMKLGKIRWRTCELVEDTSCLLRWHFNSPRPNFSTDFLVHLYRSSCYRYFITLAVEMTSLHVQVTYGLSFMSQLYFSGSVRRLQSMELLMTVWFILPKLGFIIENRSTFVFEGRLQKKKIPPPKMEAVVSSETSVTTHNALGPALPLIATPYRRISAADGCVLCWERSELIRGMTAALVLASGSLTFS